MNVDRVVLIQRAMVVSRVVLLQRSMVMDRLMLVHRDMVMYRMEREKLTHAAMVIEKPWQNME